MIINNQIIITRTDISKERWLVQCPNENKFLVSEPTKELIHILQSAGSIEEAHIVFCSQFNSTISLDSFKAFISEKLSGLGILEEEPSLKKRPSYLSAKHKILNERIAGTLSRPLQPLFAPNIFWILFILMASGHAFIFFTTRIESTSHSHINFVLLFSLFVFSTIIHELGHVSVCGKHKIKHGHIGWGVYLVFPVFYADLSNVWTASKNIRIIANLGGVFAEMIFALCLYGTYLITNDATIALCYYSIVLRAFWQLYPFVRSDGYWLLSDLTNTPNLLEKSRNAVKRLFALQTPADGSRFSHLARTRGVFVFLYGVCNLAVIMYFIFSMVRAYKSELLVFPKTIALLLFHGLQFKLTLAELKGEYLLIGIWYYIVVRYLLGWIRKIPVFKKLG